jgi:DNA-binding protein HU-beta
MNKKELIRAIQFDTGLPQNKIDLCLRSLINTIKENVIDGEKVSLVGFGTFELAHRKERTGRNPRTGEEMIIPSHSKPVFKAGKWE